MRAFAEADEEERGPLPNLDVADILAWADAWHARTGDWPIYRSGAIPEQPGETWMAVEAALFFGLRGFPGGATLARLLAEHRNKRNRVDLPLLSAGDILAWADAHYRATGEWPGEDSGPIAEAPGDTWRSIEYALREGARGLPGGSSLARLLAQERGVRNIGDLPRLTVEQVLAWADAHHQRVGDWPTHDSGPIPEAPGETWGAVEMALTQGRRGLPGGSSLARLLAEHRGARNHKNLPQLTVEGILAWADAHHRATGDWPRGTSGSVTGAPGETWAAVDCALFQGLRGLPGGSSLYQLLREHRGIRRVRRPPRFTPEQVLAWADAHHERTGEWPTQHSGPIPEAPGMTWKRVNRVLNKGRGGLPAGASLRRLLARHRGVRPTRKSVPCLTIASILAWADAHHERTGDWPTTRSGPILEAPGETWARVGTALDTGGRGLQGGSSLARLLARHRGVRNRKGLPRLTVPQILQWADSHHRRTGRWPNRSSGPVAEAPGETWAAINGALGRGVRGLPGGSSLPRLLAQHRGVARPVASPPRTDDRDEKCS